MRRHIMGHRWFMGRWFKIDYNDYNETKYLKLDGSDPERVGQVEKTKYATVRPVSFELQVPVCIHYKVRDNFVPTNHIFPASRLNRK